MLWILLCADLLIAAVAVAILVTLRQDRRADIAARQAAEPDAGAEADLLDARALVSVQESPYRTTHLVAFDNAGRREIVLDAVEVVAPAEIELNLRGNPSEAWTPSARRAEIFVRVPPARTAPGAGAPETARLHCALSRRAGGRFGHGTAVLRFSGTEIGGGARRVAVTQTFKLPELDARGEPVAEQPPQPGPQPEPGSEDHAFALAEAEARAGAVRDVLDAVLASVGRRAVDRRRFQEAIVRASHDTPAHGPEAARHAVLLAEARKVLDQGR